MNEPAAMVLIFTKELTDELARIIAAERLGLVLVVLYLIAIP